MKTKIFFLLIFLSALFITNAQKTSYETWSRILKASNVDWQTVDEVCPNFPKQIQNPKDFTLAITNWNNDFPNEVKAFFSLEKIRSSNPSKYYLGLPLDDKKNQYENSFVQWVTESKISDRRLMDVAPNFPDILLDNESFNFEFTRWQQLYNHEYENLINAKELTDLNPYYDGYIDVIKFPNFMGGLESKEKPVLKVNSSKVEKLAFELNLMNWVFVFDSENFKKEYGFYPEFPKDFNVARYRSAIIEKIDESKRQIELGNLETH